MKIERYTAKDYSIHYPTLGDLTADKPKSDENKRMYHGVMHDRSRDWFGAGVTHLSQFEKCVKEGWPDLTAAVKAKAEQLKLTPDTLSPALTVATRRKRVRTDNGSDLDIHSVYQGQIDRAWSNTRREFHETRRRAAHVYISIGGSAMACAIESQWRAATAYRICELLQRSGFSVEVTVGATATSAVHRYVGKLHTSFTAKPATMPLDLNRLAMQATLGWHRFYSFHARLSNDKGLECQGHMGITMHGEYPPMLEEREAAGELVVRVPSHISNKVAALACIAAAQCDLETFAGAKPALAKGAGARR